MKNKVAIVTGASKGIGRAISIALAKEGIHLALAARSKDRLDELKSELEKEGIKVLTFAGDLTIEANIHNFIGEILAELGQIDILINNAGIGYFKNVSELPLQEWDAMFNLNVRSVFLMTQYCLPLLHQSGNAAIINIASLAGKNSFVGGAGYAATKHALLGFTRCLMLSAPDRSARHSLATIRISRTS